MSDREFTLRLARITYGLACYADEATNESERIVREAAQLVRDLEAAPFPVTGLEPRGCPTPGACSCPAPRTITREEVLDIARALTSTMDITPSEHVGAIVVRYVAKRLGLTVEG